MAGKWNAPMVQVLIADDHEVIRRGLRQLIVHHPGWEVCAEAATGAEALEQATALKPDIVILDFSIPETDTIGLSRTIREQLPNTEVLVFTMHMGEEVMRAFISAGVRGYLFKTDTTSQIIAAIEALAKHKPFFTGKVSETLRESFVKSISGDGIRQPGGALSAREREIVQLIAEGRSNKEVAARLKISVKTVETHRATIMRKLGVNSVVELVHYTVRNKIIAP
jgi:DNA-binding NarL/FixJ family response regulator